MWMFRLYTTFKIKPCKGRANLAASSRLCVAYDNETVWHSGIERLQFVLLFSVVSCYSRVWYNLMQSSFRIAFYAFLKYFAVLCVADLLTYPAIFFCMTFQFVLISLVSFPQTVCSLATSTCCTYCT